MTADNEFTLYGGAPDSPGNILGTGTNWQDTYYFSGLTPSDCLTVTVKDLHVVGGLILSTSTGIYILNK